MKHSRAVLRKVPALWWELATPKGRKGGRTCCRGPAPPSECLRASRQSPRCSDGTWAAWKDRRTRPQSPAAAARGSAARSRPAKNSLPPSIELIGAQCKHCKGLWKGLVKSRGSLRWHRAGSAPWWVLLRGPPQRGKSHTHERSRFCLRLGACSVCDWGSRNLRISSLRLCIRQSQGILYYR